MAIYELKLHDSTWVEEKGLNINILRVPGGWIYNQRLLNETITSVFVPFNTEFNNKKPLPTPCPSGA